MSKDLTQKLNGSIEDKIDWLITAVQSIDSRVITRLEEIETRLQGLETRMEGLETRMEGLETRMEGLETRMETLEIKVDTRMKETRPIWEALQAQLTELKESQQLQFTELRESQDKGFRRFDHVMDQVTGNQTRLHADNVELESRVYKIEKRINE
jgi:chromosome segregation ATPase